MSEEIKIAYLVPVLLDAAFSSGRERLYHQPSHMVQRMPHLGDLAPAVACIAHLLQTLFFSRRPWRIGSTGALLATIFTEQ